jgi:hypothetical protein
VLAAMQRAGRAGATMKALAETTGIPRQRVSEIVNALIRAHLANVGGKVDTPGGGPKSSVYYALPQASPQAHQDAPGGHLRLVAPPAPDDGEDVA